MIASVAMIQVITPLVILCRPPLAFASLPPDAL